VRLDAGFPDDPHWTTAPGFIQCTNATGSTFVSGGWEGGSKLVCESNYGPGAWTYANHTSAYSHQHLKWLLNTSMNNVPVMAFSGNVPMYGSGGYEDQSLISYAHTSPPHLLEGWDVLDERQGGLARYMYHNAAADSLFDDYPALSDCSALCGLSHTEAMAVLRATAPLGLDSQRVFC